MPKKRDGFVLANAVATSKRRCGGFNLSAQQCLKKVALHRFDRWRQRSGAGGLRGPVFLALGRQSKRSYQACQNGAWEVILGNTATDHGINSTKHAQLNLGRLMQIPRLGFDAQKTRFSMKEKCLKREKTRSI